MAKNEANERAGLAVPGQAYHVQRFDSHFLRDGIWYVTVVCATCGHVDEEVQWVEAKTPHHAGIKADQRHAACQAINDAHEQYLVGLAEIKAAEYLRDQQVENLKAARERTDVCAAIREADPKSALRHRELNKALEHLKRHELGMLEAEKRVQNTIVDNAR